MAEAGNGHQRRPRGCRSRQRAPAGRRLRHPSGACSAALRRPRTAAAPWA